MGKVEGQRGVSTAAALRTYSERNAKRAREERGFCSSCFLYRSCFCFRGSKVSFGLFDTPVFVVVADIALSSAQCVFFRTIAGATAVRPRR